MYNLKKVAFICVHNSCRSQIAEVLGKHFAADVFESYSAGTETKPQINQDAVRLMKNLYNIDMEQMQYSKTFDKIPIPDNVAVQSPIHILPLYNKCRQMTGASRVIVWLFCAE